MPFQLEIPKDKQPRPEQEWGFTIWEFILENKWYILAIVLIVGIFLYSRNYIKKH
ncbi:hypothetical protein JM83_1316 [Gillisia sp. Hel_I_86]|uniref:hypothetical protein n=1 Tax=Gillisia sp. Hel_I_86 TaxID=1249981 RepID=UPI00119B7D41|nr:hypothetical protein [Gillisia sp. Hel_I_86]TVZ26360.1 hypothetical protein JM83_1316 [Gillisia sp. Hel_I_86]